MATKITQLGKRVVRKIVRQLPAPARGWVAFRFPDQQNLWPTPFNRQTARKAMMQALFDGRGIEQVVETGTWRGDSTSWFARSGVPVVSAEVVAELAWAAKFRLASLSNVSVVNLDSVKLIERLARDPASAARRTLFYLDAHWREALPLRDEVRLVMAHFPRAIVVIDDFEVPDDPGYKFDDYGPGKRLTLDYICPVLDPRTAIYFPSTPSRDEAGTRTGCVVAAVLPELTRLLDDMPLLRRWQS